MPGWSKIADGAVGGSLLACLQTLQKLQSNEVISFDLKLRSVAGLCEENYNKLRCLFNQFVSVFLKEIYGISCFRPVPPMLGDGQPVDLFKLYLVVREKGGYDEVSKNGLWDSVAKESGWDSVAASAFKLIYFKYLDTLDRWLERVSKEDSKGGGGLLDSGTKNPSGFLMELEAEFKGFISELSEQKKDGEYLKIELEERDLNFEDVGKLGKGNEVNNDVELHKSNGREDDKEGIGDEKDGMELYSCVVKEDAATRKRKRECHSALVDWVKKVAKDPCDSDIRSLPERSKWKAYGNDQLWKQVLIARQAMCLKSNADVSDEQSLYQIKQKMHPIMYDDHIGSGRSRCSQRILSAFRKSHAKASPESSSSATQSDSEDHGDPLLVDSLSNHRQKRVRTGPNFQAKIPEGTEETYESDPKWLGTPIWPLGKERQNNYLIERDRIGKGRKDSCGCQFQGSIECVRFHIVEKRVRLKTELYSAFENWKFSNMGEVVAHSWTRDEEKNFQAIVRSNPSSEEKYFWDELLNFFPRRSRADLVSYYFNVYLLQRRGNQNRDSQSIIDSDDEEPECGLIPNGVGEGTGRSPGSIFYSPKKVHLNVR